MNTLSNSLFSVVSQAVDEFAQLVADKYETSKEDVLELWNNRVSSELKVDSSSSKEEKKPTRTRAKPAAQTDSKDAAVCCYEFKKGKNTGTKCTAKVCPDSSKFCRKHKTQEGKEETSASTTTKTEKKTATKTPASSKAKKAESKEKEIPAVKKLNDGKPSYVLKRNKQGNYEHPETSFVFDKTTKEVYGRQTETCVEPLTIDEIEMCRKLNFKCRLPNTLSKTNDEDDINEEDEDIEEDEDEDDDIEDEDEEDDIEEDDE
jgi:RNA polymerase primary sigma factor